MLKRKIEKEIHNWLDGGDKALLIYGARQVGKTYTIRQCLEESAVDYVEFNLISKPDLVSILESSDIDDLILKLSLYSGKKITPGKTIIFLDEIQRYKEIVTKIKFLVEDGRYRYILSGSLLGVEITNIRSAPVGYLQSLDMFPMDFEEFLQIFDVDGAVLDRLYDSYERRLPIDELIHKKLLEMFGLYLLIGGMPAAVEKYRTTSNIDAVIDEHMSIIEQYKLDFTQYEAQEKKLLISNIYELIPSQLNEKSKRFMMSALHKNPRYERVSDSFVWLLKSGVALGTFNTTEPTIPLMLNEKSSLFKMFLSDVGLLTTLYGKACKLKILNADPDINKGAVYENAIAQELHAHGYPLYYYNSKKYGELDFIVEQGGCALPIEIKSGKAYDRHSALDNVTSHYDIKEALVFSHSNIKVAGKITYLPIYMIMFLQNNPAEFPDISIGKYKL